VSPTPKRKDPRAAVGPRQQAGATPSTAPIVLVIGDADGSLSSLTEAAGASRWSVDLCPDVVDARTRMSESTPQLIVIDDEGIGENDRGWLFERIRHLAPRALVIYVATHHDVGTEKRARAQGVHYYMSKPIDPYRFTDVSLLMVREAFKPKSLLADLPPPVAREHYELSRLGVAVGPRHKQAQRRYLPVAGGTETGLQAVSLPSAGVEPVIETHLGVPSFADVERDLIRRALENTGGNKVQTAKLLRISRTRLYAKIEKYALG